MLENKFSAYYLGGVRLSWNFKTLYTQRKNDVRKLDLTNRMCLPSAETFLYNLAMETRQEGAIELNNTDLR